MGGRAYNIFFLCTGTSGKGRFNGHGAALLIDELDRMAIKQKVDEVVRLRAVPRGEMP